jgi:uncharacterized glyoxalase superfamily protein PhnB
VEDQPMLDQLNLVVKNMDEMAAFYEHLGMDLAQSPPGWAAHHRNTEPTPGLHFDLDSPEFAATWNEGWPADQHGVVIGFRLSTRNGVDALFDRLVDAGHQVQQSPYDAFFGCRYAVVSDPDGNAVGLMSPRDPDLVRRATPPAT